MHVSLLLQFVVGSTQKWRRMTGLTASFQITLEFLVCTFLIRKCFWLPDVSAVHDHGFRPHWDFHTKIPDTVSLSTLAMSPPTFMRKFKPVQSTTLNTGETSWMSILQKQSNKYDIYKFWFTLLNIDKNTSHKTDVIKWTYKIKSF